MYIFYNKQVAIGSAIKLAEEFNVKIAVIDRGNSVFPIQLNKDVLVEDVDKIVYLAK